MKKSALILFLLFLGVFHLNAQRLDDMIKYPTTPQSAALYKAISAPVSTYNGQPEITIPIYTISQDGVDLPISISFNTSGVLVDEESTPLGLGVRLDWGGAISRSVNGSPDERKFFTGTYKIGELKQELPKNYNNTANIVCYPYCSNAQSQIDFETRAKIYHEVNENGPFVHGANNYNVVDLRPDDFHYNFLDKNGVFRFNQELRKFITFPLDDIKIEQICSSLDITSLTVTKSDGVKAVFGEGARESVKNLNVSNSLSYTQAWFIKRIVTARNSIISFDYVANEYSRTYSDSPTEFRWPQPSGGYNPGGESIVTMNSENLIKTINFAQGKLEFIYIRDRIDINVTDANFTNGGQPGPRLSKIIIYDKQNKAVKTFQFFHSYFAASAAVNTIDRNRLRLDSLAIQDNSAIAVEVYRFQYHTAPSIPAKNSKARDHWGYYNGANNNTTLIPSSLYKLDDTVGQYGSYWSGYDDLHSFFIQTMKGNRYVNSNYNKVFTLKKIIFPTGGEREYLLEDQQVPWHEFYTQMKDISDDGFEIVSKRFMVQGQSLSSTTMPGGATILSNTQRIVYGDEFTVEDYNETVSGEPNFYVRTNYVNPSITPSQLNMWPYKVEIGIEKKNGTIFTPHLTVTINRTDSYFTLNPVEKKVASIPAGVYRFYMKMTTPPDNVMNSWPSSLSNFLHFSVAGLTFRKKNFDNIKVGGLRIKEIIDRDGTTNYRTIYDYNNDGISSGRLIDLPQYIERITTRVPDPNNINPFLHYSGYRICSEAIRPLSKTQGSNVGYTHVTKKIIGATDSIKEEYVYSFFPGSFMGYMRQFYKESEPRTWQNGKLLSHKKFNGNTLVSEDIYDYYGMTNETDKGMTEEIITNLISGPVYTPFGFENDGWAISVDQRPNNPYMLNGVAWWPNLYYFDNRSDGALSGSYNSFTVGYVSPPLKIPYFRNFTGFDKIKSKTTVNYMGPQTITHLENFYYDSVPAYIGLTRQESSGSFDQTIMTRYSYPQDLASEPFMTDMVNANRTGSPIKTEQYINNSKISEERFTYTKDASTSNFLMAKNIYAAKFPNNLTSINSYIGQLENKIVFDSYGSSGELIQYTSVGGTSTVVIWGYNKQYPIAKIENAIYSQVSGYVAALQTASNNGSLEQSSFSTLRGALSNAMITTYTYKPLVGVASIADERGNITTFEYNSYSRLKSVKDATGKLLSEYDYNYKD